MRAMPEVQGWTLPQATRSTFFRTPAAGEDWVLVGDAAGHVDPLTGEGIWYAMWGAQLAADAILTGAPADYDRRWREAFLARFETRVKLALLLEGRVLLDALLAAGKLPVIGSHLFRAIVAE
jgi:flavin-dependent dehydrogenase